MNTIKHPASRTARDVTADRLRKHSEDQRLTGSERDAISRVIYILELLDERRGAHERG